MKDMLEMTDGFAERGYRLVGLSLLTDALHAIVNRPNSSEAAVNWAWLRGADAAVTAQTALDAVAGPSGPVRMRRFVEMVEDDPVKIMKLLDRARYSFDDFFERDDESTSEGRLAEYRSLAREH